MHRIGIDYTAAVRQRAGIGRYTRNLIRAVADLDQVNQYTLLVAGGWGDGDGMGDFPPNFRVRALPLSDRWVRILWQRLRLPIPVQVLTGSIDLFHSPDFVLPPCGDTPSLLTIHDLSFRRTPQFFVPEFRRYLTAAVSRSVSRASHVLADSKSTQADLLSWLGVSADRVTVLHPGVESRFKPVRQQSALERVRARYNLPGSFVLGLSTLQPRKNFEGLIDAFRILLGNLKEDHASSADDLHLVVAGARGWMYEETLAHASRHGLESRVRFAGFVEDADLPVLYNLARVFAFPSWYEGFGLPVLEAMACGTPVVAADNSSLPEVVGEAGLLIDAADSEALALALRAVLTDPDLATRLVSSGFEQARRFTWTGSAEQLLGLYKAFAGRKVRKGRGPS